ncbi:hypothetical protein BDF20DRAFT_820350 [Mycotypha africana]|uniref:uncharacterized protein n=1 Tax=Mycotypha africana TaxID=64632 RepID=UPI0022FFFA5C|nr:uncharacterized protein BDF20DRAFT_820350 [Mycotypha africana]KAI8979563.1 hypothetical protein BDF20DRAFT_820350 [Mycotypha africana]
MKENYGVDVRWAKNMLDTLYDVGNMTDVHQQVIPLRFGALPASDPVGHMILRSLRLGLENYRLFYEKHQDLRKDVDFDIAIDTMLQEAVDYDSYMEYVCCWARKPLFETIDIAQTNVRRYSSGLLILNNIHNHSHDVNKMILQDLNNKDGDNSHDGDIIHEENVTDINQFVEGFYED